MKRFLEALLIASVAFIATSGSARAQVDPSVGLGLARATSTVLDDELRSRHVAARGAKSSATSPDAEDTPPPPISDRDGQVIGFPRGITYAFDETISYAYGDTGEIRNQLPGGFDASLTYRVEPRTNAFVQYYQLQPQILGVNGGSTPIYNAGGSKPIGYLPLSTLNYGVSSKINVFVAGLQRVFFVGGPAIDGGHPIVFAPVYDAVRGFIGGGDLNTQLQYNNGHIHLVNQRSFEQYAANLAIPLTLTEKVTILYIATGEVLVNTNGFNTTNHPQFEQQALVEYSPVPQTTFFLNPSKALTYFPTDVYPVSTANFVYGLVHRLRPPNRHNWFPVYLQAEVITSNPDNPSYNALGVARITIVPTHGSVAILPTVSGNKFTTIQLSLGVGTPPLIVPYP
jgi:hypothetical protein